MDNQSNAEINILTAKKDRLKSLLKSTADLGFKCLKSESSEESSSLGSKFLLNVQTIHSVHTELVQVIDNLNAAQCKGDENFLPDYSDLDKCFEYMNKIKYCEGKLISKPEPPKPTARVKLPALELPSFNGDVQQFPVFYNAFKSMIHDNAELTNDQKVQYLVAKLSDKALSVVSGVPPVGANYNHIWDALVSKYLDQRVVSSFHLDQIISAKSIRSDNAVLFNAFVDKFCSSVECLRALNFDNLGEVILCHLGVSKLDNELRRLFEMSLAADETPSVSDLMTFLKNQGKIFTRIQPLERDNKSQVRNNSVRSQAHVTHAFMTNEKSGCDVCHRDKHPVYKCDKFLKWSVTNRHDYIKRKNLCFNCLGGTHKIEKCPSKSVCFKCKGKHNTLLHFDKVSGPPLVVPIMSSASSARNYSTDSPPSTSHSSVTVDKSDEIVTHAMCSTNQVSASVLLSTVKVQTMDPKGNVHELRLLLDTGSESNFLIEDVVKKLGLQVSKVPSSVHGICGATSPVKGKVDFKFFSRFDKSVNFAVKALVVNKIADNLPTQPVSATALVHLKNIILSDDDFNVPKPVVGILGASMFSLLLEPGKIMGPPDTPVAINTLLGYTILGGSASVSRDNIRENNFFCGIHNSVVVDTLESQVQKFMDIEDVPSTSMMKQEDIDCEAMFKQTFSRGADGRFMVTLPFKENPEVLGESYDIVKKRYFSLEKKLLKSDQDLHAQYTDVMQEFLDKGYMTLIEDDDSQEGYYIPQHCVVKQDRASFKLRPVFDASCATTSGKSLNDILHTGPKLYNELLTILLSFRLFEVAFTTDIKKMYLQILVHPDHRKYQKIVFRPTPGEPLRSFALNTVTFGLTPSPFLALRCVQELTKQEAQNFPLACERVKNDSYMDDVCSSVPSEEIALQTQQQLTGMFKSAGFELSKWASNSKSLLCNIPDENQLETCVQWNSDSSLKVLGLQWHPVDDVFIFQVNVSERPCTKRNVLKLTASIFDVLGLVAPVTLYAKLFIKRLWVLKLDWDTSPPSELQELWNTFQSELPLLSGMSFPRHIGVDLVSDVVLVGFGDASEKAYACAVYARVQSQQGDISVNLICAKSKVSPLKSLSIPRLELCAALLLSKVMRLCLDTYQSRVKIREYYCLSDSKVTIDWVRSPACRWNTFVANRVAKIQENVGSECFHHVAGTENISDCASRGMTPSQFLEHPLWKTGPEWLTKPVNSWPLDQDTSSVSDEIDIEEKKHLFVLVEPQESNVLLTLAQKLSSWSKLLHAVVYILRTLKILPRRDGLIILASDLRAAEVRVLKAVQQECFAGEIENISHGRLCSPQYQKLNPFIHNGLVKVGGRLSHSSLGYDQKHPVLLPSKHHVTTLIIDYYHKLNLHTGPHLLLSLLRQKFWIVGARNVVRQRVRQCNHCFRMKPLASSALMGELPACRVNESKPFVHTGTDFTGSVLITLGKRRGVVSQKAYICIFICLTTKAIHLELASDLSTEAFLAAFKRFLSRRGAVSVMYSDNGKNYIGASNKLDDIYRVLQSQSFNQALGEELARRRIQWSFLPPLSPHMGGIWEGNIRMVKQHLLKVIGSQILTFEEMYTVLTQVEALLNSRPLCPLSADPNDVQVLTPAHFIHANPLQELPAVSTLSTPENRLTRFQLLDKLVQTYWKRWSAEYLNNLQLRVKWNTPQNPIRVGQVVVVKSDLTPPLHWPLGLVTSVSPGRDGVVRVVQVRTNTGSYTRPVTKLCPLPSQ
ncbi:hypothetical protein M8J77_022994 [Diaphorina citri]|nr:hypothetical protein M8J77_022994 [Diaphorina citri]